MPQGEVIPEISSGAVVTLLRENPFLARKSRPGLANPAEVFSQQPYRI
jgi:hypothetical protein